MVTLRLKPVAGLLTVTFTAGSAPPCESTARPVIWPVVACDWGNTEAAARAAKRARAAERALFFKFTLLQGD